MIGAIAGDIIGSIYEHHNLKSETFVLFGPGASFTDDTVLTVATADALLSGAGYAEKYREWFRRYPHRGYGAGFRRWASSRDGGPYGSFGNGSAMRVSPVGWVRNSLEEVLEEARRSAAVTHDHPEGIKGAQAVAAAVYLARTGADKEEIRTFLAEVFGYRFDRTVEDIRPGYRFDVSCQGSVPEALTAFLDSRGWEDAVRKAVSLGGDSDTIASIAGAVAEASDGVPAAVREAAMERLDQGMRRVVSAFESAHSPAVPEDS